jgi:3-oxoacyl-[acyl-carrier protein] reductase
VRGIGRGSAEGLAAHGADVAILDFVPEDEAADVLRAIATAGRRALYLRGDVSNESDVRSGVDAVLAHFGRVDVLVNSAGTGTETRLVDMPVADWDRVIAVNLRGVFLCTRFVLPYMLGQHAGSIINIASQLGQVGAASTAHYSASKAGVIGFTKALAREVSDQGVRVNAIAPGPIETYALDKMSSAWKEAKLANLPIRRFGTVGEVVPTVIFLASDASSYYVGQTLCPNGGDVML